MGTSRLQGIGQRGVDMGRSARSIVVIWFLLVWAINCVRRAMQMKRDIIFGKLC